MFELSKSLFYILLANILSHSLGKYTTYHPCVIIIKYNPKKRVVDNSKDKLYMKILNYCLPEENGLLHRPLIYNFCLFWGDHNCKIFHLNKKLLIYGPKTYYCRYLHKDSLEHFGIYSGLRACIPLPTLQK